MADMDGSKDLLLDQVVNGMVSLFKEQWSLNGRSLRARDQNRLRATPAWVLLWSGEISQACSRLKRNLLFLSFAYLAFSWTSLSLDSEQENTGLRTTCRLVASTKKGLWSTLHVAASLPSHKGSSKQPSLASWGTHCVQGPKTWANRGFESALPWRQHVYLGTETELQY